MRTLTMFCILCMPTITLAHTKAEATAAMNAANNSYNATVALYNNVSPEFTTDDNTYIANWVNTPQGPTIDAYLADAYYRLSITVDQVNDWGNPYYDAALDAYNKKLWDTAYDYFNTAKYYYDNGYTQTSVAQQSDLWPAEALME